MSPIGQAEQRTDLRTATAYRVSIEEEERTLTDTEIAVGLVGCGFFGRALAGGLASIEGARIASVTDVSTGAATSVADQYGAEALTLDDLLASDIEAVFVATPNDLHKEPVLRAIEAGKHVFVEKPMALNTADCAEMLAAADSAGVALVVGHILRTLPGALRLKSLISNSSLGELRSAQGHLSRLIISAEGASDWWKKDAHRTGGELLHEIHILDLLCWLLGDIEEVTGFTAPDVSQIALRSAGGAIAAYELSKVSRLPSWGLSLDGTVGSADFDLRSGTLTVVRDEVDTTYGIFDDDDANQSLRDFAARPAGGYNTPGTEPDRWMQRAIELELIETMRVFRGRTDSPLLDSPVRAVEVATRLLGRPRP